MTINELTQDIEAAADLIAGAKHVVALVGAGISAESGIPTFRGPDGLWTKHGEPDLRDYERFSADPKGWWEKRISGAGGLGELIAALEAAQPNAGHIALQEMEEAGWLAHIITQNIDNLHQRAGSTRITEIHGNRTKLRCVGCGNRWPLDEFPIDELPPHCPDCRGLVKGDTVMFGEPIPKDALDSCVDQTWRCDMMLLIGTSAVVFPAAQFPLDVRRLGGKLIEINPSETPLTALAEVVVRAQSGEALPRIVSRLRKVAPR
jgi:NAD-dependent deacetylase